MLPELGQPLPHLQPRVQLLPGLLPGSGGGQAVLPVLLPSPHAGSHTLCRAPRPCASIAPWGGGSLGSRADLTAEEPWPQEEGGEHWPAACVHPNPWFLTFRGRSPPGKPAPQGLQGRIRKAEGFGSLGMC